MFLVLSKMAPALVTGLVIIVKLLPLTHIPHTGFKLIELAQRFFLPSAVQALSESDNLGP